MSKKNKYILTIAGFDPSGGAGILADIKTFEQYQCVGMGVQTANTIQIENEFLSVNWIDENIVISQLELLLTKYRFSYVKVGLIPSLEFLQNVISIIQLNNNHTKIIWDPILSASTGFDFNHNLNDLESILKQVYLITPNWNEVKKLSKQTDAIKGAKVLSEFTKVLLKVDIMNLT